MGYGVQVMGLLLGGVLVVGILMAGLLIVSGGDAYNQHTHQQKV